MVVGGQGVALQGWMCLIFMRACLNIGKEEVDRKSIEEVFVKHGKNTKLRLMTYDQSYFEQTIINNTSTPSLTPSQERIGEAKAFFIKKLKEEPSDVLNSLVEEVKRMKINTIYLNGKKEASLIFELQNNRGVNLTDLEKLKAYFMYQTYINSTIESTEANIKRLSGLFDRIYLSINDLPDVLNENRVLLYHCYAFMKKGYGYRNIQEIKEEYKEVDSQLSRIEWICQFVEELQNSFLHLTKFFQDRSLVAERLRCIGIKPYVYPFILKGYKYQLSQQNRELLYDILEALLFRDLVIYTRADIVSRLNEIIQNFLNDDVAQLKEEICEKLQSEYYWNDESLNNTLNGNMFGNRAIHKILWEYENHIQLKGIAIGNVRIDNEEIEHIAPQTENVDEKIASGYPEYTEQFIEEGYLHCLGNLMIISLPHNRFVGNKPFRDKLKSYVKNPILRQQVEIKQFAEGDEKKPKWTQKSINERHRQIFEFVKERWSLLQGEPQR